MDDKKVQFQKQLLEGINDDDYLATVEKNDRLKYFVREINLNPSVISNINTMMEYRDLRTEQVWTANLIEELNHDPEASYRTIDNLKEKVTKLDKDRRKYHNRALGSFCSMVNDMQNRGIRLFYRGKLMDPNKEADKYGDPNIRMEMTDFFLNFLSEVEEMNIADTRERYENMYKDGVESAADISYKLKKSSRNFGVKDPLKQDDGDISFY